MIVKSAEFVKSAVRPSHYPPAILPEIAFAGRSNVGKSSLINTLLNRKHLVKTSKTPGRTQYINFFVINDMFSFIDLPGYGYARVPESIKKSWGPMIKTYLSTRTTLKAVVLIMDVRRIPGQEEKNFIAWLGQYGVSHILVLTKADKLSKTKQAAQKTAVAAALCVDTGDMILFSAKSCQGKETVWKEIEKLLAPPGRSERTRDAL